MNPKPKQSIYISWHRDCWTAVFQGKVIFSDPDQERVIGMVLNKFRDETFWLKIENQSGVLRQAVSIKPVQ
jgi:hypothetical protein